MTLSGTIGNGRHFNSVLDVANLLKTAQGSSLDPVLH
jgi:hypothetical protein